MTTILTILLALAAGTAQNAEQLPSSGPLPEVGHSTIGYPTVAKALLALRQKPGTKVTERDGWTIVQEEEPGNDSFALWSFTPAGHPAHPAVAKRTVFQKDGHV